MIHQSAIIHPTAQIAEDAYIGPNVVIGENTIIKKEHPKEFIKTVNIYFKNNKSYYKRIYHLNKCAMKKSKYCCVQNN